MILTDVLYCTVNSQTSSPELRDVATTRMAVI